MNSGYLQIENCILEDGMICAQHPSTVSIKFCTFRHTTIILQNMNASIIENCEFSQSDSANIIIEGQPKGEKNWTHPFLRDHTNAIFQQKRSLHRKRHCLKATSSMTSTIHSSFTSKSLTTGYSAQVYDTISHDPSYSFDEPGASFLYPNILQGRYLGSDRDGMVGCGDLQSMYHEPEHSIESSTTAKLKMALPVNTKHLDLNNSVTTPCLVSDCIDTQSKAATGSQNFIGQVESKDTVTLHSHDCEDKETDHQNTESLLSVGAAACQSLTESESVSSQTSNTGKNTGRKMSLGALSLQQVKEVPSVSRFLQEAAQENSEVILKEEFVGTIPNGLATSITGSSEMTVDDDNVKEVVTENTKDISKKNSHHKSVDSQVELQLELSEAGKRHTSCRRLSCQKEENTSLSNESLGHQNRCNMKQSKSQNYPISGFHDNSLKASSSKENNHDHHSQYQHHQHRHHHIDNMPVLNINVNTPTTSSCVSSNEDGKSDDASSHLPPCSMENFSLSPPELPPLSDLPQPESSNLAPHSQQQRLPMRRSQSDEILPTSDDNLSSSDGLDDDSTDSYGSGQEGEFLLITLNIIFGFFKGFYK